MFKSTTLQKTNPIIGDITKFIQIQSKTIKGTNISELQLSELIPRFNIDKELTVISFLGNARIGKSTLMNCFVSNLMKSNVKVFNTSITKTGHCTSGIDILTIEMKNKTLVLLDVQGFDFGDSKDDCKIMLFVFMISNIIVYNQKGILTNTVLSSFQSLTSLVVHIKDEQVKPQLLFRSIDIDYDKDAEDEDYDPENNLNDMLNDDREDQYTSVRKSIRKLFTSIKCKPTFSIDKNEKKLLNSNKFIEFMSCNENGFSEFCNYLFEQSYLSPSHNSSDFIDKVQTIIQQINSNQNIDCKIFDSTTMQSKLSISEWEKTILQSMLQEIEIDGTQLTFNNNVDPVILYKNKILDEFDSKFSMATPAIRDEKRSEILNKFDYVINKATKSSLKISNKELEKLYTTKIKTTELIVNIDQSTNFIMWHHNNIKPTHDKFVDFISKTIWMNSVKVEYIDKVNRYVKNNVEQAKKLFKEYGENYWTFIHTNILLFEKFINSINIKLFINNIKHNFIKTINIIKERFINYTEIKWTWGTYDVQIFPNVDTQLSKPGKLINQKQINNDMIDLMISHKLVEDIKISNCIRDETDQDIIDILNKYINNEYAVIFETERLNILGQQLENIQTDITTAQNANYTSLKKYHSDNKQLYDEIVNGGNNVKYLNLFDHLVYYINWCSPQYPGNSKFIEGQVLTKYMFILSKMPLCKIYTETTFNKMYADILPYYNLLEKDKVLLNYELVKVIIDNLFVKCIENK